MEIEAKLAAPAKSVLDEIAARAEVAGFRAEARPTDELETIYLDTPSRVLRAARIAVRVRRAAAGIELTVKRPGRRVGEVHHRPEWTVPLVAMPAFPWIGNAALAGELGDVALDGSLSPIVATAVRRRAVELLDAAGRIVAEIDLDEGRSRRPAGAGPDAESEPYFEVEVELRQGDADALSAIVAALRRDYPLEPARLSKLERALRWAGLER